LVQGAPIARLPTHPTPLIGRDDALAALHDLLLHADARLLTLTGIGGSGKTRLALQLASDFAPLFSQRAWFVELAPIADPTLVPLAVMNAIGLRDVAGRDPVDTIAAFLRSQPALLILDNCEHLIDACASLAEQLLRAAPSLRILATSREPLLIAGERQHRVATLAVPDPAALPGSNAVADFPAVQLFVIRARAILPAFRLTPANAPLIARICARLDGIPLALELAAARVHVLTLEQMLDRLDDSIRLLVGGSRVAPTRQQTMRAAFAWSDALLTAVERVVFYRLAVFAGAFTLEAVEAVCADADLPSVDVFETLTRLVDKSLVTVTHGDGRAWYRLLEPLRQYAQQHLTARGEAAATEARHVSFYTVLAEQAARALRGSEQAVWLVRLDHEQGNLRAALRWAAEHGEHETGLRLATALVPFWEAHGHLAEGQRWLATLLAAGTGQMTTLRVRALVGAGRLAYLHAAYDEAMTLDTESLALARAIGDAHGIAAALTELGMVCRLQRDLPRSTQLLEEGLARYRALGDEAGIAFALLNLGSTISSPALLEESIARHRALGDLHHIAIAQALLGQGEAERGEYERAVGLLIAVLRGHAHLGDRWFVIFDLLGLAEALMASERTAEAVRLFAAAQALAQTLGSPVGEVTYQRLIAVMTRLRGDERYAAPWAEGAAMGHEEAVAAALALTSPAPSQPGDAPSPPPDGEPLTRREQEVAQLLARGDSDRQIAEALSISVKTVGVHVHHILQKLDLYSRVQVADWLHAQHPD
jgi:non-specific serine/threonine protein kinase